ncbi:MAG: DUF3276 family protein [Bacteroidales bacterium]|nr:DUF3276 family protein [Deltaproteobacteria bacterium]MBL7137487.1 DUF3276 family protein [Bacteroidales bacterium]
MEENEKKERDRGEIFSKAVRAGKRTYFFDVKATISDEYYLTITESKRRFNNEQGKFFYEKHKLFLYKEDFQKFTEGLTEVIDYIKREQSMPEPREERPREEAPQEVEVKNKHADISFEDLESDTDDE